MLLLEKEKLKEVLRAFYTLTGVRIAVLDEWYNEIASYPEQICALCRRLRADEDTDKMCKESDRNAFRMVEKTGKQYTYRCPMRLYESVYPIVIEERNAGFLMIGQFILSEERDLFEKSVFGKCGDGEEVRGEVRRVTVLSADAVPCIASVMTVCAEYLCFSKTISAKDTGLAEKVRSYVAAHIAEPISVQRLADHFRMSRTSVYLFMKKSFGKGVSEYVNAQKMLAAKQMIDGGASTEEVLEKLNFSDANYFRRMFKKHMGVCLRDYRRREAEKDIENTDI